MLLTRTAVATALTFAVVAPPRCRVRETAATAADGADAFDAYGRRGRGLAHLPDATLSAVEVVTALCLGLKHNDVPAQDGGSDACSSSRRTSAVPP